MTHIRRLLLCVLGAVAVGAIAPIALAQTNYPAKPIRIVVGFAAGGPADILSRLLGDKLTGNWGQPVIVESVTGAGGNLAMDRVARSGPDGYTLLMASSAMIVVNPSLYQKLSFDPSKDLAPISQVGSTPNILVVHNNVPANSVHELVKLTELNRVSLRSDQAASGLAIISPVSFSSPWLVSMFSTFPTAA